MKVNDYLKIFMRAQPKANNHVDDCCGDLEAILSKKGTTIRVMQKSRVVIECPAILIVTGGVEQRTGRGGLLLSTTPDQTPFSNS